MADGHLAGARRSKFTDPDITADGAARASVAFTGLKTLWINSGTLCNLECANCYIESSPTNDQLVYIKADEAAPIIDEAIAMGAEEIGITGGEPFMNREIFRIVSYALERGVGVLLLTNAMKPMMRPSVRAQLFELIADFPERFRLRISFDHFTAALHDGERGEGAFASALEGAKWLSDIGAALSVAGRFELSESESDARHGYQSLFEQHELNLNAADPADLVLFPEMAIDGDPPEITTDCWDILNKAPSDIMCASSRMVVKRKGADKPSVLACTLIAYDDFFDLGETLEAARQPVKLKHPFCASFCVLGGSNCSG